MKYSSKFYVNFQAQVTSCQEKIKSLEEYGASVLKIPGVMVEEVDHSIKTLSLMTKSIQMSWDYRLNLLTKLRDEHVSMHKVSTLTTEIVQY